MSALDRALYDPVEIPSSLPPTLLVVIDTEEEFDWTADFSRDARGVRNIAELPRVFEICARYGAVPLCVIDHPVADDEAASALLRGARDAGLCEIGAHLHGWVNPPYEEAVSARQSYGCNLPPELEYRKIAALTDHIRDAFGTAPTMFRTGRYGVGAQTFEALASLGYRTDLSLPPHSNFSRDGGPSFYGWSNRPFWANRAGGVLSLPITTGFSGVLRGFGTEVAPLLDKPLARRLHLPGVLARSGLLERSRLTPEGTSNAEMNRLLAALVRDGERVLTLSLHSSTLLPGATVYARDQGEVDAFLARLDGVLRFFAEELGGKFAAVSAIDARLRMGSADGARQGTNSAPERNQAAFAET